MDVGESMILSRCCRAEIYQARSVYSANLSEVWFECSYSYRPCATIDSNTIIKENENDTRSASEVKKFNFAS